MPQRQQTDHRQGTGQQPSSKKESTSPQGRGSEQEQEQQNDVNRRESHAESVGQQLRPDRGFHHAGAQSRRIKVAKPMLTARLTTPRRALQKALSLVLRKSLKELTSPYSSVVPSVRR